MFNPNTALLQKVVDCARQFYDRRWMWGTAGNLSVRLKSDPLQYAVTASGLNKGELTIDDFVVVNANGEANPHSRGFKPSAESSIHQAVYETVPTASAVFHVHAINAALMARKYGRAGQLTLMTFPWFEMLKGVGIPEGQSFQFPIFPNHQNIPLVGAEVKEYLRKMPSAPPALLLHDHGITVWGRSPDEARNHLEIMEYVSEFVLRQAKDEVTLGKIEY